MKFSLSCLAANFHPENSCSLSRNSRILKVKFKNVWSIHKFHRKIENFRETLTYRTQNRSSPRREREFVKRLLKHYIAEKNRAKQLAGLRENISRAHTTHAISYTFFFFRWRLPVFDIPARVEPHSEIFWIRMNSGQNTERMRELKKLFILFYFSLAQFYTLQTYFQCVLELTFFFLLRANILIKYFAKKNFSRASSESITSRLGEEIRIMFDCPVQRARYKVEVKGTRREASKHVITYERKFYNC